MISLPLSTEFNQGILKSPEAKFNPNKRFVGRIQEN